MTMSRFHELERFEEHFERWSIEELESWREYWTEHARHLQPKVQKEAMKRVVRIEKRIMALQADSSA
jgi:hypothetical protein